MRVLFSQNFAYVKFRENKSSQNDETTLSFTDVSKSCPSHKFLISQICLLTLFVKIKFSRIFLNLHYLVIDPYMNSVDADNTD